MRAKRRSGRRRLFAIVGASKRKTVANDTALAMACENVLPTRAKAGASQTRPSYNQDGV
jgi:hypothetical protein